MTSPTAAIDIDAVRADTPACADIVHLNNAGAALPPKPVLDAQIQHLAREAATGGYEAAADAAETVARMYDSIAAMLGCDTSEIAFVDSATRAWDMAFYGVRLRPGHRILTGNAEYASGYIAFLHRARRDGVVIDVIPDDEHGQLDVNALRDMIDDRVALIAVTHAPTNGGLVNPAAEIGRIARDAGVLYLLDACQSAGHIALDVDDIGCDFLSATGRKYLRGPRGTGFLYARTSSLERIDPPVLDLQGAEWVAADRYEMRPDARRFELWERSIAGMLGLGAAVDYALALGLDAIEARVTALADHLRALLGDIPGAVVRDKGVRRSGIVCFTVDGLDPAAIQTGMRAQSINVTTTSRSSTFLDMNARGLDRMVRASVHYYNTEAELARFADALRALPR